MLFPSEFALQSLLIRILGTKIVMARTRTQQKAVGAKASAAVKRAGEKGGTRRSSIMKSRAGKPTGRVQWNTEVAVKGSEPCELIDHSTMILEDRESAPGKKRGRPTKVNSWATKSRIRTISDLPPSPISPESPGMVRPEGRSQAEASNVRTLSDIKTKRTTRTETGPASRGSNNIVETKTAEAPTRPDPGNESAPPDYGAQKLRSSLVESVKSLESGSTPKISLAHRKRRRASHSAPPKVGPKRPRVEFDAAAVLNSNLHRNPRPLLSREVGALFAQLKKQLHQFAVSTLR